METKSKDKPELYYDTNAQPKINEFLAAQIEERRFRESLLKKLQKVKTSIVGYQLLFFLCFGLIVFMLFDLNYIYSSDSIITVAEITVNELIEIISTIIAIFAIGSVMALCIACAVTNHEKMFEIKKEIKQEYEAKYGKNIFNKDNL